MNKTRILYFGVNPAFSKHDKNFKIQIKRGKTGLVRLINVRNGKTLTKASGAGYDKEHGACEAFFEGLGFKNLPPHFSVEPIDLQSILDRNGWRLVYFTRLLDNEPFFEIEMKY